MITLCPHCEKEIEINITYIKSVEKHTNPSLFIIKTVTEYFNEPIDKLIKRSKKWRYVYPRHLVIYFLKQKTKLSWQQIADMFERDYTTAIHSVSVINNFINTKDESVCLDIDKINYLLN